MIVLILVLFWVAMIVIYARIHKKPENARIENPIDIDRGDKKYLKSILYCFALGILVAFIHSCSRGWSCQ